MDTNPMIERAEELPMEASSLHNQESYPYLYCTMKYSIVKLMFSII